nr:UPF0149 family protein [Vogesella sp.]
MKSAALTDQDYQRLSDTLARFAPQGAMSLEKLDGFFAALLCGPEQIKPVDCLPAIMGAAFDDDDAFHTPKAMEQFVRLLSGHWLDIAHTLQRGQAFQPWLDEDEHGQVHGNVWAEGFSEGMQLMHEDWGLLFDDEDAAPALAPIMALAFEHHPDPEMRPFLHGASAEQREAWLAGISDSVAGIYTFFAQLRAEMAAAEAAEEDE